jgi:zona occludens toxin
LITLITGAPGAGKTAALMDILQNECQRRALYVDGIPELQLPHVALEKPRDWMTLVEDGAAVVIDEVQRIWRPRGSAAAVPPDVAGLETHRHRGLDFYLVTQHPNLLDANVRRLVGRHVHLRDVGLLGRWWYEWPEATNPETFRNAPIKKSYRLPKKVFGQYKSASLHVKPIRSVPRSLVIFVLAVLAAAFLVHRAYASLSGKITGAQVEAEKAAQSLQAVIEKKPAEGAVATASQAAPATLPASISEPAKPRVVGCLATPKRCACFTDEGTTISVEWELCQTSAKGFGGVVPLAMSTTPAAASPARPASVEQSTPAISLGGNPRGHIQS